MRAHTRRRREMPTTARGRIRPSGSLETPPPMRLSHDWRNRSIHPPIVTPRPAPLSLCARVLSGCPDASSNLPEARSIDTPTRSIRHSIDSHARSIAHTLVIDDDTRTGRARHWITHRQRMRSTSLAAPRRACACRSGGGGGGGGGGDGGGAGSASRARRTARPTRVATSTTSRTTHREKYGFDWTATATAEQRAHERERERRAAASAAESSASSVGGGGDGDAEEERWKYAHESDAFEYRGAWLDLVSRQRQGDATTTTTTYEGSGSDEDFEAKVKKMRRKATKRRARGGMSTEGFVMGGVEYEAVLGELVEAHVRLARRLSLWRTNFVLRFEREPEYADMPVSIRNIELDWISLGFKIRSIEK